MPKPLSEIINEKADKAKYRVMKRLFSDFCQCKTLEERELISAKVDVLTDLVRMFNKELKETEHLDT